jgi:hypothetical protein
MRTLAVTIALLAAGAAVAQQPASPPAGQSRPAPAEETFHHLCLERGPAYNATIAYAKGEKWAELAPDMAMAFTPVGEPSGIEGWTISDGEEQPFAALVIFKGKAGEKDIEGCSLASSQVDATAFEKRFTEQISARRIGEETGEDTIYRRYTARAGGRDIAIAITLPRYPKGSDQVTVSAVAAIEVEN